MIDIVPFKHRVISLHYRVELSPQMADSNVLLLEKVAIQMMGEVIHELAAEVNNTSGFTADGRRSAERAARSCQNSGK